MANDLDKFVLQYQVDLKDSISRLEKLHDKMGKVKQEGKDAANGIKDFAADAASELGKLVPGLDAVSKAVRGMGGEFAIAAAAIGTLAVAVKSVIDLRAQFNAQRQQGMDLGVSGLRLENYQRAFVRGSGGYVDSQKAVEGLMKFREMTRAAFTDPSRMGRENIVLRRYLGVNVGAPGSPNTFNNDLTQLAAGLQGKSQGEIEGIAKATGFAQDWLMTLQKLGPQIGSITELTEAEVQARGNAQKQVDEFNDSLNKLKGDFNQLEIQLGQGVLPAMDKLVMFFSKLAGLVNTVAKTSEKHSAADYQPAPLFQLGDRKPPTPSKGGGWWDRFTKGFWEIGLTPEQKKQAEDKKAAEESKKAEQQKLDAAARKEDAVNQQGQATADQMTLAINQFASAVGEFAGAAPSIQEVLAAWAGGAGKAAGLPGSSNAAIPGSKGASGGARGLRNNNPGNLEYGAFAKAHGATGSDGRFAIFPDMATGAAAQQALLQSAYLAKGLDTPAKIIGKYAPANENNQKAYLAFLASKGFSADTKITGANLPAFSAAQMAYESGYNSNPNAKGWTRQTIQFNEVARGLAGALRVPPEQLLRGGVSQRDIAFAIGASRGKLEKEITGLQTGIATLGPATDPTSKLKLTSMQMKLRSDTMKLQNLDAYGGQLMARGNPNAPNLPTIESQMNTFNIHSTDPKEVAKEVEKVLSSGYNDAISDFSTGRKS